MKRKYEGVWVLLIAAAFALVGGCPNGDVLPIYEVGDTGPAGGLIFYVDDANAFAWTYLEAAPKNEEFTSTVWADESGFLVGAEAQDNAIGDGEGNTEAIVDSYENNPDVDDGYAAQLCDQLILTNNGETYNDWFFPSRDELNAMYENLHAITVPLGDFTDDLYWSSTETDNYNAVDLNFNDGTIGSHGKINGRSVRAVRSF